MPGRNDPAPTSALPGRRPAARCVRTLLGAVSRVVGGVDAQSLAGTPAVNSRLYHVRRFYYDTAASANPIAMQGLKTLLGETSHIVFDLPYGTPPK